MKEYIHSKTGEHLSWLDLKKRINASIPVDCPQVKDENGIWELAVSSDPVGGEQLTIEQRIAMLESEIARLAEGIKRTE